MESNTRSKFNRICVFCGSNAGHRKVFSDAAVELGNELVGLILVRQFFLVTDNHVMVIVQI